ncbi:hypothetical protein pEaSNUABM35_00075 [Erwinia phage pEa_SNUABM_35]|uniref:Uncharacterized protein n=1 Tax=Erwinia phage pEa_SNUABM_35 TaxID=2869557 RepID=A0AAE7XPJ9_9CAUD|nr:hypothetical protein MPK65_gp075 [Erwinia phage pEa_SNUABM_35]QZE59992.1 hypothetical protein pEaSNUABM35_00075 [Erwinia phage pEa_SNUABM_35]QZE60328.1 hypothetical protein pEaSNUABM36_00075 [Erwinia phage pEa_SNUABM_36]
MRVSKAYNSFMAMAALNNRLPPNGNTAVNAAHIALFSGTPPTDAQLNAMIGTAGQAITWSAAAISSFATATNFLGDVMCGVMTVTMDIDNNVMQLPFSAQTNLATIASSGTPTWFMMRLASAASAVDTFAGFAAGGSAYVVITGTVGDENSNADLKIVGGTVVAGQPLRLADMRIKY